MAKVHITLVGREIEPIYNGIVYSNPDFILFVRSTDEKSLENTEVLSKWFANISSDSKKIDPVDMADINAKVQKIAERFQNDEITINISSGTKPWSYFFSTIFGGKDNAQIFYVDQKNRIWNLTGLTQTSVPYDFKTVLKLHCGELPTFTDFNSIGEEDVCAVKSIIELDMFNHQMFSALVAQARKFTNMVEWNSGKHRLIKDGKTFTFELYNGRDRKVVSFSSPHSHMLLVNTGWFEYRVARVIKCWKKSQDVWMNCVFHFNNKSAKNEIDVIANLGDRMLFVECKTKIDDYKDIDKFRSAMINYAGNATIGLFVANEPLNNEIKEKCRNNKILAFSFGDYKTEKEGIEALVKMLEEQYIRINS